MDESWIAVIIIAGVSVGLVLSAFAGILMLAKLDPLLSPSVADGKNVVLLAVISIAALLFIAWSFKSKKKAIKKKK